MQFVTQTIVALVLRQLEKGIAHLDWAKIGEQIRAYVDAHCPEMFRPAADLVVTRVTGAAPAVFASDIVGSITSDLVNGKPAAAAATVHALVEQMAARP